MGSAHFSARSISRLLHSRDRRRRKQRTSRTRAGENRGSSVALMDVAVDRHGGADFVIPLQAADRDSDVVDHAESFAVVREGVMEASANADAYSVLQGLASRED